MSGIAANTLPLMGTVGEGWVPTPKPPRLPIATQEPVHP